MAAYLSLEPAGTVFPRWEISRRTRIPYVFVSKILQSLTKAGFCGPTVAKTLYTRYGGGTYKLVGA